MHILVNKINDRKRGGTMYRKTLEEMIDDKEEKMVIDLRKKEDY